MDDLRFGLAIRAARVRRRLRQRDVARAAGVSDVSVSRLERGQLDRMALSVVRAIGTALDVRVELQPRSRTADLERVANAAHAALGEAVVTWLSAFDRWVVRPEIGFSHYGERGVIDLVAWHPGRRALLVIELKTELVDLNGLLASLDRHARNAIHAVAPLGWRPAVVGRLLVIGDSDFNRSRVRDHATLLAAALPSRVVAVRRWLREPIGGLAGLTFFADRHLGTTTRRFTAIRRVRTARTAPSAVRASSAEHAVAGPIPR